MGVCNFSSSPSLDEITHINSISGESSRKKNETYKAYKTIAIVVGIFFSVEKTDYIGTGCYAEHHQK